MAEHRTVVVVGAGTTGLSVAVALRQFDIDVVVVERNADVVDHPRGHVFNARSMEIFRRWGVRGIAEHALPAESKRLVVWKTSVGGDELGRFEMTDHDPDLGPAPGVSCPQDFVERALLERARALGADVRYGHAVTAIEVSDGAVELSVASADTAATIRADYVVAADGASSFGRAVLGIDMDGHSALAYQLNVCFRGPVASLVEGPPALLYWIVNERAPGVFINMGTGDRWVFNLQYDPRSESIADYPAERCAGILAEALGAELDVEILSIRRWILAAEVATRYRSGRVFLCGDAAHRFPPTGGLGANTGIADAHNLAWKLAFVLGGRAPAALLDTYEHERAPIARGNAVASLDNARQLNATGAGRDARANGAVLAAGGAAAAELRQTITAGIAGCEAHFDHPGQDVGYVYDPGPAVLADGGSPPGADPEHYTPSGAPGARMPHVWLPDGRSTLDLVGCRHLVVCAPEHAPEWEAALATVFERGLVEVHGVDDDSWWRWCGHPRRGALVVRPDDHIAARLDEPADVEQLRGLALGARR